MKILLVTGTFKPSINGVSISTEVLSNNFKKLGHSVLVIAPHNALCIKRELGVLRYPSVINPFMTDYPIPLLPLTPAIYKKIKKFSPDIVHVQHPFHIGFFARYISDNLKIPLVFTYHTKHDYYAKKYFKFLPNEVREEFIQNRVLDFSKKCNLVIAPSKDIEDFLSKNDIKNTVVIPSIVDDLKKTKSNKQSLPLRGKKLQFKNKKNLLFVGRLATEKNINLLIEAVNLLPKDFVLTICGTGPLETEVKEKVKSLKLKKQIIFAGKVERENLSEYYEAADYFCYSSKSETQGLIYWEALSFGLPVVSVDSKVAREWVKGDFGVITKSNAKGLAKGIEEIGKKNYKLLSKNAIKFSKKFSSKKSALKMISEYKKLI